ncbi:hypothetical protein MKW98_019395 [Papaver atlanticum]|uniref:Heme O synthase n=1 Tax=Papaver atlanticum TaxID=357466 RepID=A0AAD4XBB6_9MAGN|nr:hypothetical protein MKW98_019395 [Papaver atlanticum]
MGWSCCWCIPPLLGWAAAAGHVSLNAVILPAALYFWQLPHFIALAGFTDSTSLIQWRISIPGIRKSDADRPLRFSSSSSAAAAVVGPSVAATTSTTATVTKARDVAEAVKYYGHCYWELSGRVF